MAASKNYLDSITEFTQGVNSGFQPILLPKNQLAWAINATVRGAFVSPRPPFLKKTLNFGGDSALELAVTQGLWQGGGVYRPDFGPSQILAQISGRLFRFVEGQTDWMVTEITIPGDADSATNLQSWMAQSEKWMIISDGTGALPIFYDGVACRRSYGPSVLLATAISSSNPAPTGVNTVTIVQLSVPYTGPMNATVLFNGFYYQTLQATVNPGSYEAILTAVNASSGSTVPSGSSIVVNNSIIGTAITAATVQHISGSTGDYWDGQFRANFPSGLPPASFVANGVLWTKISALPIAGQPTQFFVEYSAPYPSPQPAINIGDTLLAQGSGPNVEVAKTSASFLVPPNGSSVTVLITQPYTGPSGQAVYIGTDQYTIAPGPVNPPSNTLYLLNLTDTTTLAYVFPLQILSVPELPAGRMGAYGLGRNWMSLIDGQSFIGGDIVGGPSGSQASDYRDAVLKTTENAFLAGGGSFRLPGAGNIINSMTFVATLDTSLGQGPLMVGTDSGVFSCQTPVDRSTWNTLTNPILTDALIGDGPRGQNSTIAANSDTLFRSSEGAGSLVIARRDFRSDDVWGNAPISREVSRALSADALTLLNFSSADVTGNRLLMTCHPTVSAKGTYHPGMIALNFDLISSLRGKLPPVYDGLWTGINVLQLLQGSFSGVVRTFAFGYNVTSDVIELFELSNDPAQYLDNGDTRIKWIVETPVLFNKDIKPFDDLARLQNGEIYIRDVIGQVDFKVMYRPDFNPCWTTWREFSICASTGYKLGYRTRLGLGEPDITPCETGNNRPMAIGHIFQFRIEITGQCKFMGARFAAAPVPEVDFAPPQCNELCSDNPATPCEPCQTIDCTIPDDFATYSIEG